MQVGVRREGRRGWGLPYLFFFGGGGEERQVPAHTWRTPVSEEEASTEVTETPPELPLAAVAAPLFRCVLRRGDEPSTE